MMLFPPRKVMTTAEPPEPLYFSASRIHYMQTNSSEDWRPGGEAFCLFRVFSGLQTLVFIGVHSWFQVQCQTYFIPLHEYCQLACHQQRGILKR